MKANTADSVERPLAPGERRYIAKAWTRSGSRVTSWGVYDRARASWPFAGSKIGLVKQNHKTEVEAQREADRLEALR